MAVKSNLISVRDAAREKGVSRQAIYKALDEGRIREVALGASGWLKKIANTICTTRGPMEAAES